MKTNRIIAFPETLVIKRSKCLELAVLLEEEANTHNGKNLVPIKNMSEYIINILKKHFQKNISMPLSIKNFIEKCVIFDSEALPVPIFEIYQKYVEYCKMNNEKHYIFVDFLKAFYRETEGKDCKKIQINF